MTMVVMKGLDLRKRMVKIFGDPSQCKAAKQRLMKIVDSVNAESRTVHLDEYTDENLDSNVIKARLFENLKEFSELSRTSIIVRQDTVEIYGDQRYIDESRGVLDDLVDTFRDRCHSKVIDVPHDRIGDLIGKGGKNIRRWKKVSGCDYVGVLTDEAVGAEQGFVEVEIIGKEFQTEIAAEVMMDYLATQDKTTHRHVRKILTDDLSLLMDNDGEFLRNLMLTCNIDISIDEEETMAGNEFVNVKMVGSGASLKKAHSIINKYMETSERPEFFKKTFTIKQNALYESPLDLNPPKDIDDHDFQVPRHFEKQLKSIEWRSGALFLPLERKDDGNIDFTVVGSRDEIKTARSMLDTSGDIV